MSSIHATLARNNTQTKKGSKVSRRMRGGLLANMGRKLPDSEGCRLPGCTRGDNDDYRLNIASNKSRFIEYTVDVAEGFWHTPLNDDALETFGEVLGAGLVAFPAVYDSPNHQEEEREALHKQSETNGRGVFEQTIS